MTYKELKTKELLALFQAKRKELYKFHGQGIFSTSGNEEYDVIKAQMGIIKTELDTREHLPNANERKEIRKRRAKNKKERTSRARNRR